MTGKTRKFKLSPKKAREAVADALESGKYTQGRDRLIERGRDAFCCLGVACDVFKDVEGVGCWEMVAGGNVFVLRKTRERIFLPREVADWLGFRTVQGDHCGEHGSLADDNDNGVEFSEIAKKFRDPPEGLLAKDK